MTKNPLRPTSRNRMNLTFSEPSYSHESNHIEISQIGGQTPPQNSIIRSMKFYPFFIQNLKLKDEIKRRFMEIGLSQVRITYPSCPGENTSKNRQDPSSRSQNVIKW